MQALANPSAHRFNENSLLLSEKKNKNNNSNKITTETDCRRNMLHLMLCTYVSGVVVIVAVACHCHCRCWCVKRALLMYDRNNTTVLHILTQWQIKITTSMLKIKYTTWCTRNWNLIVNKKQKRAHDDTEWLAENKISRK